MTKFVRKIYRRVAIDPFHVLHTNRMLSFAGADRLQNGMRLGSVKEYVQGWCPLVRLFCLFVVKTAMSIMLSLTCQVQVPWLSEDRYELEVRLCKFQQALIIWKFKVEIGCSQMELMLSFWGVSSNLTCCTSGWESIIA